MKCILPFIIDTAAFKADYANSRFRPCFRAAFSGLGPAYSVAAGVHLSASFRFVHFQNGSGFYKPSGISASGLLKASGADAAEFMRILTAAVLSIGALFFTFIRERCLCR